MFTISTTCLYVNNYVFNSTLLLTLCFSSFIFHAMCVLGL